MKRILVVDDDADILYILSEAIEDMGYKNVGRATGGTRALEVFNDYDIIFTDWMMPGISGLELCRRIKAINPFVYIVMVTARSKKEDALQGLIAGANDYIVKPFDLRDIEMRIHLAEATIELNKAKGLQHNMAH